MTVDLLNLDCLLTQELRAMKRTFAIILIISYILTMQNFNLLCCHCLCVYNWFCFAYDAMTIFYFLFCITIIFFCLSYNCCILLHCLTCTCSLYLILLFADGVQINKLTDIYIMLQGYIQLDAAWIGWFLPRDAMVARYILSSCVRLSVCPSVTSRYCVKTAKHRVTQTTSHNSQGSLVF